MGAGIVNYMSRDDLLELDAQKAENGNADGEFHNPRSKDNDGNESEGKATSSAKLLNETAF